MNELEAVVARSSPLGLASVDLATPNGSALHVPSYLRELDEALTDLCLGHMPEGTKGLVVSLGPRFGKSMLSSIYLPSWYVANFPDRHVGVAAAEVSLSTAFTRESLAVVRRNADTLALEVDPHYKGATGWRVRRVGDKAYRGSVRAFGVGGSIIGRGFSVLLIDDPVKNAAEAHSKASREKVWNWWTSTASTRLEPGGVVVVIMSRWHEDDLVGRLITNEGRLEEGGRWNVIDLPAVSEDGESLWPERWPVEALEEKRQEMGSYYFDALYMGRPSQPESGTFDVTKIKRIDSYARLDGLPVVSADLAYTGADERGDFTGVVAAGRVVLQTEDGRFVKKLALLDAERFKAEDPLPLVADFARRQPRNTRVLVETKTRNDPEGRFLLNQLKKELKGATVNVRRAPVSGRDKTRRAAPLITAVAAGDIVACRTPGVDALLEELAQYPSGAHDDLVDSASFSVESLLRPQGVAEW